MKKQKRCLFGKSFSGKQLFSEVIPLIVLFLSFASCDITDNDDNSPLPPLPDDTALFISIDDAKGIGLRVVNANSFELLDSLNTSPGVPWTIEFSPDHKTFYSAWNGIPSYTYNLYKIDLTTFYIQQSANLSAGEYAITSNKFKNYIIAYGSKGIGIFDHTSLNIVHRDTTLSTYHTRLTMSKNYNRFYFTKWLSSHLTGFGVYDLDSMKITDEIIVFDDTKYEGLEDVDIVVSNDDRYLFFSGWTWLGGFSGYGSFFVVDLIQKRILKEFRVGAFSQIAISPDGQSVYISDPGGYLYMFPSTRKVWRYDVKNNSINVLLNTPCQPDRIAVAEDNRTIFISSWQFIIDGKHADIIKVDAQTGRIVSSYSAPLDSSGALMHTVRNIKIGKYPNLF